MTVLGNNIDYSIYYDGDGKKLPFPKQSDEDDDTEGDDDEDIEDSQYALLKATNHSQAILDAAEKAMKSKHPLYDPFQELLLYKLNSESGEVTLHGDNAIIVRECINHFHKRIDELKQKLNLKKETESSIEQELSDLKRDHCKLIMDHTDLKILYEDALEDLNIKREQFFKLETDLGKVERAIGSIKYDEIINKKKTE